MNHDHSLAKLIRDLNPEKNDYKVCQEIITPESNKENVVLKIKLMTPILMHVEKCVEIDNEFSVKQIDYSTRVEWRMGELKSAARHFYTEFP